jgi:hypothetical protein
MAGANGHFCPICESSCSQFEGEKAQNSSNSSNSSISHIHFLPISPFGEGNGYKSDESELADLLLMPDKSSECQVMNTAIGGGGRGCRRQSYAGNRRRCEKSSEFLVKSRDTVLVLLSPDQIQCWM